MSRLTEMTIEEERLLRKYRAAWLRFKRDYVIEKMDKEDVIKKMEEMQPEMGDAIMAEIKEAEK